MNFLEKIDFMLNVEGLSKRQFSQKSMIPYTTIDGWYKKGYGNMKLSTLKQTSNFFNVPIDVLCDDSILLDEATYEAFKTPSNLVGTFASLNIVEQKDVLKYIEFIKTKNLK